MMVIIITVIMMMMIHNDHDDHDDHGDHGDQDFDKTYEHDEEKDCEFCSPSQSYMCVTNLQNIGN